MYLLDTNILSEVVKQAPAKAVIDALAARVPTELFASEITRYELRFGVALLAEGEAFWNRIQFEVVSKVGQWLPVTQEISERAGDIRARLRSVGRESGTLDPLLAATAIVHDCVLVTRNIRHFEGISGLRIENWFGAS